MGGSLMAALQWSMLTCCLLATTINAITDPLPNERIAPMAVNMHCPNNKEFKWRKTEPSGKDIDIVYGCGDSQDDKTQRLRCSNGNKATYRRDLIPTHMRIAAKRLLLTKRGSIEYNQEPDFGLFSTSDDPNILNSATAIYMCMKPVAK